MRVPRGREFFIWPPTIAFLVVTAALLATSAVNVLLREREFLRERAEIRQRIAAREAETRRLTEETRSAAVPAAIERLAKERLNLKRPGEEVVVIEPLQPRLAPERESSLFFAWFSSGWIEALSEFFGL